MSFKVYTEKDNRGPRPLNCSLSMRPEKSMRVSYNRNATTYENISDSSCNNRLALCTGSSGSEGFFQLGQQGVVTVVFNIADDAPASNPPYSPVCGSGNWRPASPLEPLPPLNSSSLVQQARVATTCTEMSHETCCENSKCNTCSSRRRHETTITTQCSWWADLACCKIGTPCPCG